MTTTRIHRFRSWATHKLAIALGRLGLAFLAWAGSTLFSSPAAGSEHPPKPPLPPVKAGEGDWFEDVSDRSGVRFLHQFCHQRIANILLSNGAGGAVFDYDNDGLVDLYLLNWGPLDGVTAAPPGTPRQPNRLYRNRGDGSFEDRTSAAGLAGAGFSSAAAVGDIDNDGDNDLYVANVGRNLLYRNRGDGTFEEVTEQAGVGDLGAGISAVFLDIDNDGWLDLYLANYLTYVPAAESEQNPGAYPGPLAYQGEADVLYRNRGGGTFEDVTRQAGVYAPRHRAMSVSAFDCDRDGDVDIYVSNDDTPNALWLNDGKGNFRETGIDLGVAFNSIGEAPGSMNAAVGDCTGDGLPDIFVTRLGYGSFYVRQAKGWYEDRMWVSGLGRLTQPYVGWGGCLFDFDNDGDLDIFVANGDAFRLDGTRGLLLENEGQGTFVNAADKGGAFFETSINGRGAAILDYDNDGRLDILVTALADRAVLLRNRCPLPHHWIKLQLEGTRSNRNGYGALVSVEAGPLRLAAQALCPTGFLLQGDPRLHFGLGTQHRVDTLRIRWPSGTEQVLSGLAADQILKIREPSS